MTEDTTHRRRRKLMLFVVMLLIGITLMVLGEQLFYVESPYLYCSNPNGTNSSTCYNQSTVEVNESSFSNITLTGISDTFVEDLTAMWGLGEKAMLLNETTSTGYTIDLREDT